MVFPGQGKEIQWGSFKSDCIILYEDIKNINNLFYQLERVFQTISKNLAFVDTSVMELKLMMELWLGGIQVASLYHGRLDHLHLQLRSQKTAV